MFRVFGVGPELGRIFTDQEGFGRAVAPGEAGSESRVVVLSHGYWRRRFGSDAAIVGKTLPLDQGEEIKYASRQHGLPNDSAF